MKTIYIFGDGAPPAYLIYVSKKIRSNTKFYLIPWNSQNFNPFNLWEELYQTIVTRVFWTQRETNALFTRTNTEIHPVKF